MAGSFAQKHDVDTFQAINSILNEAEFERIVEDLCNNQKWHYNDLEKFRALRAYISEPDNAFASDVLREKAESLFRAVHQLISFSAGHFFVCDHHCRETGGEFLYRLYPRLQEKIMEGDAEAQMRWDGHVATLGRICRDLRHAYGQFHGMAGGPARQ